MTRPTILDESASENAAAVRIVRFTSAKGNEFWGRPETEDVGVFEYVVDHNEYNLPPRFTQDDVIIDIGAHIGSFSYAVLRRGAGKVYAYEAHPDNYAIACRNLEGFEGRLHSHNLAVWRSDIPTQTLHNEDISGYQKTGGISVLWNNEGLPVQTISLDAILSEASNGFQKPIRLMKIDCEGSEYPILFTSTRLDIVEEIRGEYHEMKPEQIPERAKTAGFNRFDRFALRDFFEAKGWEIDLEPKAEANGLFHARPTYPDVSRAKDSDAEISIEKLMAHIRSAVARREAQGQTSFINASAELFKLLADENRSGEQLSRLNFDSQRSSGFPYQTTPFRLQPTFTVRADNRYQVDDLLQYHDREFIWNAYRALLQRDPDEEGLRDHLERLRSGRRNKIDILSSLKRSPEGQRANVTIEGLALPAFVRRIYRLPIVGYIAELTATLARLPVLMRSQRQLETHLIAQQDRIVSHFGDINQQLFESQRADTVSLKNSLASLARQQREIAELQHQQVSALFRQQHERFTTQLSSPLRQALGQDELDSLQAAFEDRFRGDENVLKDDLRFYLSLLKESDVTSGILDLGSGRGKWLELLKEEGLQAEGVELNSTLAAAGRSRGLELIHAEALQHLSGVPDNRLEVVTAFHLLEHLEFNELVRLLKEIRRTLRPGGFVVIETPNPKNLVVGACNFYADLTHRKPLFPETLQFLLDSLGFEKTRLEYRHPVEGSPFDDTKPGSRELDIWLFGPRDFAAIGWKA